MTWSANTTTIHVLVSAVQKLASVVKLPDGLKLYRGLGGVADLPESFFKSHANGGRGFTEWGFMSTTSEKQVAIYYSFVGSRDIAHVSPPMVLELTVNAIDRGACIKVYIQITCMYVSVGKLSVSQAKISYKYSWHVYTSTCKCVWAHVSKYMHTYMHFMYITYIHQCMHVLMLMLFACHMLMPFVSSLSVLHVSMMHSKTSPLCEVSASRRTYSYHVYAYIYIHMFINV
jgi:hypothetical protein